MGRINNNKFIRSTKPPSGDVLCLESLGSLRDEIEYYIRAHNIFTTTPEQLDLYEKSLKNWCLAGKLFWEWMYDLIPSIKEENERIRVQKHKESFKAKREAKAIEIAKQVYYPRIRKPKVKKEKSIRPPKPQKNPYLRIKKERVIKERNHEREYAFKLATKHKISIEDAYILWFKTKEQKLINRELKKKAATESRKKKLIEATDGKSIFEFANQAKAIEWYAKEYAMVIPTAKIAVFRSIKNKAATSKGLLFRKKYE